MQIRFEVFLRKVANRQTNNDENVVCLEEVINRI